MNEETPNPPPVPPPEVRPKFQWWLFLLLLLGPAVLTCLMVLVDKGSKDLAPAIGFIGGALGGIASGIVLGLWVGRTGPTRVVLSMLFIAVCGVASISLAMFGCLASGYQLNFH